jgi:hypothetical protein
MTYMLYLACLSPIVATTLIVLGSKFDLPYKSLFTITAIHLSYLFVLAFATLFLIPLQLLTAIFLPTDPSLNL